MDTKFLSATPYNRLRMHYSFLTKTFSELHFKMNEIPTKNMSSFHIIGTMPLDLEVINELISVKRKLKLSEESKIQIEKSRNYLDDKIKESEIPIYGINTGFGSLCNVKISAKDLNRLQENLVASHACGTGNPVSMPIIRLILLLKIQSLSYGKSGVALETVQRLIEFYNEDILPVIYEQGSLGASGDLAPLAHMSLPLLGKGE
ncbi:MAG TPA: aromatic amino acid lyase, partial [Gillisia sp.]|nr:aromatic amino acid lyase [Gillisia sp.]